MVKTEEERAAERSAPPPPDPRYPRAIYPEGKFTIVRSKAEEKSYAHYFIKKVLEPSSIPAPVAGPIKNEVAADLEANERVRTRGRRARKGRNTVPFKKVA